MGTASNVLREWRTQLHWRGSAGCSQAALHSGGTVILPDLRALSWTDPTDGPVPSPPRLGAGARRLAAAVVERAIHDVQSYPAESAPARDARRWLTAESREPYAFLSLCEALDLDAAWVRAWVLAPARAAGHRKLRHIVTR